MFLHLGPAKVGCDHHYQLSLFTISANQTNNITFSSENHQCFNLGPSKCQYNFDKYLKEHRRSSKQKRQGILSELNPFIFQVLKTLETSVFYYQFTEQFFTWILTFIIFISHIYNCYLLHYTIIHWTGHLQLIKFH